MPSVGTASISKSTSHPARIATEIVGLIDADADGQIDSGESGEYARRVIGALGMSVDGRSMPITLVSVEFPDRQAMAIGMGTIRLRATTPASDGTGRHELVFRNAHAPASSVYLVNALVPSDPRIQIATQQRDVAQQGVTLDYSVAPSGGWARSGWLVAAVTMLGFLRNRRVVAQLPPLRSHRGFSRR